MKKLKKLTLNELRNDGRVICSREQMLIMGGGDGTFYNPYTEEEAVHLMNINTFNGGFVIYPNGETTYCFGVVTIYGYYSSSYNNPWITDPIVNGIGTVDNYCDAIASALEYNAGQTRVGSNMHVYFETKTGRVFYGNQYVATTSLSEFGKSIDKWLGPVGILVSVYNVVNASCHEGLYAGVTTAASEVASYAGSEAGALALGEAGAIIGTALCPVAGTAIGTVIGGVVGGIIGSVGGSICGDYLVELVIDK